MDEGVIGATFAVLRRCVGTRPRRWLIAITLLLGLVAAVAMTTGGERGDRTFAALSDPTQSLMSVTVPLIGILLTRDLRRVPRLLAPTLLAAALLAAAVGVFGVLVCATALAIAPSSAAPDPWRHAGTVAVGSVLVQVVAQLVGTGMGLLLRSPLVAFPATFVPLGVWFVLGAVDVLRPARGWVTPYATATALLSGSTNAQTWTQWLVVLLIWGVGLNAVGVGRLRRREPGGGAASVLGGS